MCRLVNPEVFTAHRILRIFLGTAFWDKLTPPNVLYLEKKCDLQGRRIFNEKPKWKNRNVKIVLTIHVPLIQSHLITLDMNSYSNQFLKTDKYLINFYLIPPQQYHKPNVKRRKIWLLKLDKKCLKKSSIRSQSTGNIVT